MSVAGTSLGRFASPLTVTGAGPLTAPGTGTYRGALEFRPDGHGGVETVNAVGLDDYVRGVISEEMPASWPAQALAAQAVASRTYAVTTAVGGSGYDLYADTRSQMYGGVAAQTAATDAAVAAHQRADRDLRRCTGGHLLLRQFGRLHRERRERLAGRDPGALAARSARSLRRRRWRPVPPLGHAAEPRLGCRQARRARPRPADRDQGGQTRRLAPSHRRLGGRQPGDHAR